MSGSKYVPLVLLSCFVAAACEQPAGAPEYEAVAAGGALAVCDIAAERVFTFEAGENGGTFASPHVTMSIPAGALDASTTFTLRVPSTPFAEVEIRANGAHSFNFLRPVTISIGYGRCGAPLAQTATVWHIDPVTKAFLEDMRGVNDVAGQSVVFSTMHLSGYAIAN